MFADLHCHCHMRSYLHLSNVDDLDPKDFHPWNTIATNMYRLKHADRAAGYSQGDLVVLWNSNVRLVYNSLYPIEREFFKISDKKSIPLSWIRKLTRIIFHHDFPIRKAIQNLMMRIPMSTINHVASSDYDYWIALEKEYRFICSKSGVHTKNAITTPGLVRQRLENQTRRRNIFPAYYNAEGVYEIPQNKDRLIEMIKLNDRIIMPLTIEGAHFLEAGKLKLEEVFDRIDYIKNNWQYPVFFITLAHHFNNDICGHAHSLPKIANLLLDQREFMDKGFTEQGIEITRKLLSLDQNNDKLQTDAYRILIDMKHMSALARKEFYQKIINPCLQKGDEIPLVASHCAYAGIESLDELISNQSYETDDRRQSHQFGKFYAWNINLCDEDILMIFRTRGIIGLSFDKRMLGVAHKKSIEKGEGLNSILAFWNNLKAFLQVIYTNKSIAEEVKIKAWDMISIGTDFDGYIDPVSSYKTALQLTQFKADLIQCIKDEIINKPELDCLKDLGTAMSVEEAVEKFSYSNALEFCLKHYPDKK